MSLIERPPGRAVHLAGGKHKAGLGRLRFTAGAPKARFPELRLPLARLNALAPASYQTPFQYLERLYEEMPDHRQQLSTIIGGYVRFLYGRKETTEEEAEELVQAWLEVRLALLFHLLRRRGRTEEATAT